MARADLKNRQFTIYARHDGDLSRWKDHCPSTMTLNGWLVELIELGIEETAKTRPKNIYGEEINQLRKDNLELKQENERLSARVHEVESIYEKSRQIYPHLDKSVVDLLLRGGTWTSPKITEKLLIADKDEYKKFFTESHNEFNKVDRVKGINRTLEQLELVGLVKNTRSGWVWNKK